MPYLVTNDKATKETPMKKIIIAAALAAAAFAGCGTQADTVSKNISTEAEQFKVGRHIVVTSGINDKVLYDITGRCSWETPDVRTLEVVCLDDKQKGQYTKATIGLGDQDSWASVQLGAIKVNAYRTKIIIRPTSIVPDLDLVTGEQG